MCYYLHKSFLHVIIQTDRACIESLIITGNIGQFPTWVKLGSNLGNNNSQLLKLGFSWGKVGFYFES